MLDSRVLLFEGHNLNKYGKIIHIIVHHVTSLTFIVECLHFSRVKVHGVQGCSRGQPPCCYVIDAKRDDICNV
jgi:hypothetical protein